MKRMLFCIFVLAFPASSLRRKPDPHQQGTIIRMRMTDCLGPQHGFMATMSGGGKVEARRALPGIRPGVGRVVYVISGKSSDQLIPLAEITRFRLQKNEMLIRMDDAAEGIAFPHQGHGAAAGVGSQSNARGSRG